MSRFIRKRYKDFKSYTPGEQPADDEFVKLNTNESPFPPAPEVVRALDEVDMERLRLYPDPTGQKLKEKLAKAYGVDKENVFVSNGSDDILNFSFMAFNEPGSKIAFPDVTYSFYEVVAGLHGLIPDIKPLSDDMSVDVRDYIGISESIVIPNPNAPTGIALDIPAVESVVSGNPDNVVLIDEAYVDFGAESSVSLTKKYDNILVSHTFSKSRSFAGGRLGFAIADAGIIDDLGKMQYSTNPYNVNTMSLILAEAAIDADEYYMANSEKIQAIREEAAGILFDMGFFVLPSKTNFLFVRHDAISGKDLYDELRKRKVLVRHFDRDRIRDYNRITIGSEDQMEALYAALRDIL